jgi:hypothetical protein
MSLWRYFIRGKCVDNKIILKWRMQISRQDLVGLVYSPIAMSNLILEDGIDMLSRNVGTCVTSLKGDDINDSSLLNQLTLFTHLFEDFFHCHHRK